MAGAIISKTCAGGDPEIGMYHAHVSMRRAVVGWRHTNDDPEGLKKGKLWCCVSNHRFHVYDEEYNRGAQGVVRFCGHANFTMIRMFHPYFCFGNPQNRDRMSVPEDMVSQHKEMCRRRWAELMHRHPYFHPVDEDESEVNARSQSDGDCGENNDSDNNSSNESDHEEHPGSSPDLLEKDGLKRTRRRLSSACSLRSRSSRVTTTPSVNGDSTDNDGDDSVGNLDELNISDPFNTKRRQPSRLVQQSHKRPWPQTLSSSEDEDAVDESNSRRMPPFENPRRIRSSTTNRGSFTKRARAQPNRIVRRADSSSLYNPRLPSLAPSDRSSEQRNLGLLQNAFRMGTLSPPPTSFQESAPVRSFRDISNSLFILETRRDGVHSDSAIEVKDEDDDSVIVIKKEDFSLSWTPLTNLRAAGTLNDDPVEID